ncbi:MAG: 50S ribosomal protein L29 [Candidatus Sumerlaeia bacterium]
MKASEYRDMNVDELTAREGDLRKSLFNLRTRATTKELENVSRIKEEKKELARLLTVLAEKQKSA